MNFRFQTRFFTPYLVGAFIIPISAMTAADFEIGTWGNFCQGAVSHTFDDYGQSSLSNAAGANGTGEAAFDAKGFHSTIFVITGSASATTWTNCKYAFSKGHEIASHSVSHPGTMPASELAPSQKTIKQNVPGEMCATIAYPNCNTPGKDNVLGVYIAGRNCSGSLNNKSPTDFSQINSKGFGSGSGGYPNDANSMNSFADQAASSNGWAVYLHHGVGSDSHSWAVTNLSALTSHIGYLDQNKSKIWCETFGNVARYIKERDAKPTITQKSSAETSFTMTITDNLADSIFNYPLSIRCPLPTGWTTSIVTQGTKTMPDTIVTVNSKQYIQFKAIPDGGDVVISKDPVAVIRSASACEGTFPVMRKHATLIIDTRQFNGSTLAVTLFGLTGKVLARYTLGKSDTRIVLPADKINQSAFIAKITGGNKTYIGRFMPQ